VGSFLTAATTVVQQEADIFFYAVDYAYNFSQNNNEQIFLREKTYVNPGKCNRVFFPRQQN